MKTELLDAYLTGDLAGESAEFIESALKNDAALREYYFQQVRMDAALRKLYGEEPGAAPDTAQFAAGVMARIASEPGNETEEERRLAKSVLLELLEEREAKPRPFGWGDWAKAAVIAAAAAVLAVVGLKSVSLDNSGQPAGPTDHFVAQVTAEENTTWGDVTGETAAERRDDGWVRPGKLELKSGVAEITFNSGARVFLEGPALLDLERPNRGFLERGRLTAEVPPAASGFVINTPRMNIVDLGTRFGVSVESGGDSEVHVMEGIVEVSRSTGNSVPMIVREGLAVRADGRTRSRLQVVEYGGDQFALRVANPQRETLRYVRYTFDESGGPEIEDSGVGIEGGPLDTSLFPEDGHWPKPQRSPGTVGGALNFRGGEALTAPGPEMMRAEEAHAVSFWIKIPPRANRDPNLGVVSLETADQFLSESGWQIRWNPDSSAGTVGALRVDAGNGYLVGSTDLRDGRWHQVTAQFLGGEDAALSTHVHLYVDGQLETTSGAREGRIPEGRIARIAMGANIDGEKPVFSGWIDEFHLFRGSISPLEFQKLASEHQLP